MKLNSTNTLFIGGTSYISAHLVPQLIAFGQEMTVENSLGWTVDVESYVLTFNKLRTDTHWGAHVGLGAILHVMRVWLMGMSRD